MNKSIFEHMVDILINQESVEPDFLKYLYENRSEMYIYDEKEDEWTPDNSSQP